jgi:hypothetical protein
MAVNRGRREGHLHSRIAKYFDSVRVFALPFTPFYTGVDVQVGGFTNAVDRLEQCSRGTRMRNGMFDDLLFVMIITGIGFSGAYLRAEVLLYRRFKAAERRREALQRELHTKRVRPEQMDMSRRLRPQSSQIQTNVFPAMRVLACVLRNIRQERNIHSFWFHT